MQLSQFTLKNVKSNKGKLTLEYNYGLTVTLKKYWFITAVKVKRYNNVSVCVGFNSKDLLHRYYQGYFDNCINECLV